MTMRSNYLRRDRGRSRDRIGLAVPILQRAVRPDHQVGRTHRHGIGRDRGADSHSGDGALPLWPGASVQWSPCDIQFDGAGHRAPANRTLKSAYARL